MCQRICAKKSLKIRQVANKLLIGTPSYRLRRSSKMHPKYLYYRQQRIFYGIVCGRNRQLQIAHSKQLYFIYLYYVVLWIYRRLLSYFSNVALTSAKETTQASFKVKDITRKSIPSLQFRLSLNYATRYMRFITCVTSCQRIA